MFSTRHEQHHVVHIGGAEFVPPMMTHFAHVPNLSLSTSPSSEASGSAASSPVHSRFSSSSTASSAADSLEEWDAVQAHLAYARRMADHTASMWQKERLAIEKAKLDGTYTGNMTSRQNGNARPPADAPTKENSEDKKKHKRFAWINNFLSPQSQDEPRGRSRSRRT
ncbi:hypothetical protein PANT_9c00188 [Moesziomyces antarcticus T-34]|uniref:Uncharacterized protein n=1 Tax=Pseudozyma antarctica (strain T-34) TaxID=1151754 RepID=M9MEL9_PSEA3|nr:hypothetical protein PANT_9c00188 [Moesziomyces antarcticus T-34]